jgi:hypothetical protein
MDSIQVIYHCEECNSQGELTLYNNALLCPECLAKEQVVTDGGAPSADDLKAVVFNMIERVYEVGLKKHGKHKWYYGETVRHHTDRAIRHISTAMMRRDGNESIEVDGENCQDHLERGIIRALFALSKVMDNHK